MTITISAAVGYHGRLGGNRPTDVQAIHGLLSRVPGDKGGPRAGFDPKARYSPKTDEVIYAFQTFHKFAVADATINPDHETLALLNQLAQGGAAPAPWPRPGPAPQPVPPKAPGPSPEVDPVTVLAVMTSTVTGQCYVKGYDGKTKTGVGRFRVPLYRLRLGIADVSGTQWALAEPVLDFDVVRFGVYVDSVRYAVKADYSCFRFQGPILGEYTLARDDYMSGSWLIKGHYYIHDGPNKPDFKSNDIDLELVAAIGCIELCWPNGMGKFDHAVRKMSFGAFYDIGFYDKKEADERITASESFRCLIEPAPTPPLLPLTDFRRIGGPRPISG